MANTGFSLHSQQRSSISQRRYLKFELLDQRRVLASIAGPLLGDIGPALRTDGNPSGAEVRVVYLDFSSSPTGSQTTALPPVSVDGVISADELAGAAFAGDHFAGGEIVAGNHGLAYAVRGRYLNQIDLEAGSVESLELPAPILSAQLLSDGRLLALLENAGGQQAQQEQAEANAVPALIVVSFASGEWESVAVAGSDLAGNTPQGTAEASEAKSLAWFAAALARGDSGLLVPMAAGSGTEYSVTLRSLHVDPGTDDVVIGSLPFQVAAGTRAFASPSGPLALISQPSDGGRRISLWSTRVDATVTGSERVVPGISDVLMFDDATSLAVARQSEGGIQIFDGANRFAALHRLPEWTGPVAMDAEREWLFGIRDDRTLEIFGVREGRILHSLPLDMGATEIVGGLALADGGNRLVLSTSAGIAQLRLDRLEAQRVQTRTNAMTIDQLFGDYGSGEGTQNLTSSTSFQQGNIDPGDVSVAENELGALIAHLQVTGVHVDQDVTLHVEDERFVLEGSELRLAPDVAFDFEQESVVRVEVVLLNADSGDSLARQTVVITVTDVDDPVTAITLDRQELPERTPGHIVSPVRVIDQDSDDHTLSVDDGRFEIRNGNLKLREGVFVRRSDQSEILVTITASDTGTPTIAFAQEFVLTVTANELPLHNPSGPTDVNGDGHTDPLDALLVINVLNKGGPTVVGDLSSTGDDEIYFYDVNGDGRITPLDALIIINEINRRNGGQAESGSNSGGTTNGLSGEGEAAPLDWADAQGEFAEADLPGLLENAGLRESFPTSKSFAAGETVWRGTSSNVSDSILDDSETTEESSRDRGDPRDDFFSGLGFNA